MWCSQSGNDLQEDLVKFGYKLNVKIKFVKHPFFGQQPIWTMYRNDGNFFLNFGQNSAIGKKFKHF